MAQLTFAQLAQKILAEEKRPLSPNEIWEKAIEIGYDKQVGTKGITPVRTLGAKLYVDIRDNPNSPFIKMDTTPKRFFLKSIMGNYIDDNTQRNQKKVITGQQFDFLEKDLHSFLTYFGFHYLRIYLKTIHHNKSGKKDYGEWVHPDMVGCYFPFIDWKNEVVELSTITGNLSIKLYSFELKRELTFSNIREAFFQAVSNSTWANEGYLVAAKISTDEDFRNELKRLSVSFDIGIINLNLEDPDDSEIIYPAKSKENLDWETINKLTTLNIDFKEFIKRIKNDISNREVIKELYEKPLEKEILINSIQHNK